MGRRLLFYSVLTTRAGLPTAREPDGMSLTATLPTPMTLYAKKTAGGKFRRPRSQWRLVRVEDAEDVVPDLVYCA